jgi:chromatin segregation and condensation protein Rec8/ScpA/Scc1 (kleisin family)
MLASLGHLDDEFYARPFAAGNRNGHGERIRPPASCQALQHLPLAPLIDQYLRFREQLAPEEAHERVSDFLPLAATLIHLKSRLFLQQVKQEEADQASAKQEIVDEIRRAERRRREPQATQEAEPTGEDGPPRLTLLDLMMLLNDVRNSLRAPLTVSDEDLSVRDAMR